MFDIDEGRESPALLGLGNRGEGERGFTRGFRSEDLDNPSPREAADSESAVNQEVSGWDSFDIHTGVVAQAHDGGIAEVFLNLGNGKIKVLLTGYGQLIFGGGGGSGSRFGFLLGHGGSFNGSGTHDNVWCR